jgi:nitrous oxidase accessory protein NosD
MRPSCGIVVAAGVALLTRSSDEDSVLATTQREEAQDVQTPGLRSTILVTVCLVAGLIAATAPAAGARSTSRVKDLNSGVVYRGASALSDAIDAASSGDTLQIKGRCKGNYQIGKDLILVGKPTKLEPHPTLDGSGSGSVLSITSDVVVTDLRITGGNAPAGGGVVVDAATLVLDGSTTVTGNVAGSGGGVWIGPEAPAAPSS